MAQYLHKTSGSLVSKNNDVKYFSIGEECVVYENIEDLYAKVAYYLAHEEERKAIAEAGFKRVKRDFTFKERLEKMLNI